MLNILKLIFMVFNVTAYRQSLAIQGHQTSQVRLSRNIHTVATGDRQNIFHTEGFVISLFFKESLG